MRTGQAVARLFAAAGFGAAWTIWGPGTALVLAAGAMGAALSVAWAVLPASMDAPLTERSA
ncbi:hypothetical protein [Streptomyces sp. NPDC018833]|uniref:hypothetical protein n=1 Tax=Streptomyces sp. NPDC018833 TaxID=3365053 RepID=UPI0037B732D5